MQDAEDALQETLLSAWRGLSGYEGHGIATRVALPDRRRWMSSMPCACSAAGRRRRPSRHSPRGADEARRGDSAPALPDALLEGIIDTAPGPDAIPDPGDRVELAFVAALQHLPPRQRAVLLLRDVLGFHAAEVARHARDKRGLGQKRPKARAGNDRTPISRVDRGRAHSPTHRQNTSSFAVSPMPGWPTTSTASSRYSPKTRGSRCRRPLIPRPHRDLRIPELAGRAPPQADPNPSQRPASIGLLPHRLANTRSSTQPVLVLTLAGDRISAITHFVDSSVLGRFGLPRTLRS